MTSASMILVVIGEVEESSLSAFTCLIKHLKKLLSLGKDYKGQLFYLQLLIKRGPEVLIIMDIYYCNFRSIDFESLLGTVGGYIGLILGYTLVQMPEYLFMLFRKSKALKENFFNSDVWSRRTSTNTVLPFTKNGGYLNESKRDCKIRIETEEYIETIMKQI